MHDPDEIEDFKFPEDQRRPDRYPRTEPPEVIPHPDMVRKNVGNNSELNMSCPICGEKSINTSTGKCSNCSGISGVPPVMDSGRNPERHICPKCGQDSFFPESNQCLSCFYTASPSVPGHYAGMPEVEVQGVPGCEPNKPNEFGGAHTLGRDHVATPAVYKAHGKHAANPKSINILDEMERPREQSNTILLREILIELKTFNSIFRVLTSSITAMTKDFRAINKKK